MYMVVAGKHFNDQCCFDYGNAETDEGDDGPGTMEAIYWGNNYHWSPVNGTTGPWVMADLEQGMWAGNGGKHVACCTQNAAAMPRMLHVAY